MPDQPVVVHGVIEVWQALNSKRLQCQLAN